MKRILILLTFSLFAFCGYSQNRLDIKKQTELSATPGSIIVTDGSNEQQYTVPGTNGQVLTIVGGVPAWAAAGTTSITLTDGTTPATLTDGSTITINDGSNLNFTTTAGGAINVDWAIQPSTGGTNIEFLQWDDNTDAYSWVTITQESSSVTDNANGLDITLTGTAIDIAYDYTELANIAALDNANDRILLYDASGTTHGYITPSQLAGSFTLTDGTTPATINDGGTITLNDGANLNFTTTAGGAVNVDWAVAPTTGGTTIQLLTFDDNTDTYVWQTAMNESTTVTDQANGLDPLLTGSDITIAIDVNELTTAALAAGDELIFGDISNANSIQKTTAQDIVNLASWTASDGTNTSVIANSDVFTFTAGTNTGITKVVGTDEVTLSMNINDLATTTTFTPAADFIAVDDGGTSSKITFQNLISGSRTCANASTTGTTYTDAGAAFPTNTDLIEVYVNGIKQVPTTHYARTSGTVLTFTWALTADIVEVCYYQ